MSTTLQLFVGLDEIADYVLELSRLEDLHIQLPTDSPTKANAATVIQLPGKKDEDKTLDLAYSLTFQEVVPLAIALAGTMTSLLSFATALLSLRLQKSKEREAAAPKPQAQITPLVVVVEKETIVIESSTSPEELANRMYVIIAPKANL